MPLSVKFMCSELLTRMESFVPRLRACAAARSGQGAPEQNVLLEQLEVAFRDVMALIDNKC